VSISSEITVKGPAFAAAVGWVAKWATSKPVTPIQGGMRISGTDGGPLVLTAFGESVTARALLPFTATGDDMIPPLSAVVSARLIREIADALGKGDVTIRPGPEGTVQLRQGRATMTLPTMPEQDYPTLPGTLTPIGEVGGDAFAAAVRRIGVAAAEPGAQPVAIACLRLGFTDTTLEIMAGAREHAATLEMPWTIDPERAAGGEYAGSGDIPAEATPLASVMVDAAAAFGGPDLVEIGCDGSVLSLTSPTRSLTLRTMAIDGGWPASHVRRHVETQMPHAVMLEPATAVTPLKLAAIMRGKSGPIRMTFTGGEIRLSAMESDESGTQTGKAASDDAIDATGYTGEPVTIGFNPQYVTEALTAAPGDKVTASFEAPHRPLILRSDADPTWRHVVMPVRIRD
jgi:DNA polymerase-3 subunit beta